MLQRIREDIKTVFEKDPAARSTIEVLLCYSGMHAIWAHRVAHWLWNRRLCLLARLLSQASRFFTGIEIHPGATIGRRFFIDHGMGVVIGETAEVGDDVLLYQGVVLGGTSREKKKRHPTLKNGVVVGAGAVLLGPVTVGEEARVGAGSVVIDDVEPGTTVVGVPGHDIRERRRHVGALEHGTLPDPVDRAFGQMRRRQEMLMERIEKLEDELYGEDADRQKAVTVEEGEGI